MEYDKLKEEMNKRRLMPKKESWDELETRLDQSASNSKIGKLFTAAASVVTILITTSIVFFVFNTQSQITPIAKQQKNPIAKPRQSNVLVQPSKAQKDFNGNEEKASTITVKINNITRKKSSKPPKEPVKTVIAKTKIINKNMERKILIEPTLKNKSKDSAVNSTLARNPNKVDDKLENLEKPPATVVKNEVDDLLANAHASIKKSELKEVPTKTDPNALLRDAEWDARVKQKTKLAGWINKNLKTFAKDKLSPKNSSL